MAGPADMSELHAALDRLRPQLCHCGLKGECLGCKGIEMIRVQAEAVVAAASQPILIQVAQEASMEDMATRCQALSYRLLSDPDIRRSAEEMQQRLMSDPETRQLLEELMRRLRGAAGGRLLGLGRGRARGCGLLGRGHWLVPERDGPGLELLDDRLLLRRRQLLL